MNAEDRALLTGISNANAALGALVPRLLGPELAGGRPDAEVLRALAAELDTLAERLRDRADTVPITVDAEPPL